MGKILHAVRQLSSKYYKKKLRIFLFPFIIVTQMSLPPEHYFKSCLKYLDSLYKDGRKITPDFALLNEFYLIIEGDSFKPAQDTDP